MSRVTPARPGLRRATAALGAVKDGDSRRTASTFTQALYGAVRAIKFYPIENEVVQTALAEVVTLGREMLDIEGELDVRMAGEFIFVNGQRIRLDLSNYTSFTFLRAQFRAAGLGHLRVVAPPGPRDWTVLLAYLLRPTGETPEDRFEGLVRRLGEANLIVFEPAPLTETGQDAGESKEAAKRTYQHSVAATKEVMASVRMGQTSSIRRIKRVVQGIVDHILSDEVSLMGLTTIRDYDDYTFTHSVNVCIFAVALGRRLGLHRVQLYDLGMAALFHDIGKSRVPREILEKPGHLTEADWRAIAAHPWLGVLALFQLRDQTEYPYRAMLVAYQHHMKLDLSGYPRTRRTLPPTFYARIVAVADGFDAATARRAYQTEPMTPATALREMRDNPRRGMDPLIVKAFINLLGIYPVGTLVVLDTFELAIVHSTNPNDEFLSRPVVRIVSDAMGNVFHPGHLADLAEQDEVGMFRRTIIKTADPDRYGIRVGDYFL